jgi:hypothetical protein
MKIRTVKTLIAILLFSSIVAPVTSVSLSQGTLISLTSVNSTIEFGNNMSFDNLTVYGDKVSFGDTNLSIYAQNNQSVVFNMTGFQADSTEPVTGDIIYMGDNDTNLSFEVQNLPAPEKSYNVSLGGQVKEFSNRTISTSLNLSENSSLKVSETSIDDEVTDPDEGDGGGSTGGGGSGGGSTGGGGLGGLLGEENDSNESYRVADVEFKKENLSLSMENGTSRQFNLTLVNRGNKSSDGVLEAENISFEDMKKDLVIGPGEEKILTPVSEITRNTTYSGSISYDYSNATASIPVEIQGYVEEPEINSSLEVGDNKANYTVNVSEASEGEKVETKIYEEDGKVVYSGTEQLESGQEVITKEIKKNLEPGNYSISSEIISERVRDLNETKDTKEEKNPPVISILSALTAVIIILSYLLVRKRDERDEIVETVDSNVQRTKTQVMPDKSDESIDEIIGGKLEEAGEESENLKQSLTQSKRILTKMEELDSIPEKAKEKEAQIEEDLRGDDYSSLKEDLDELEEILKQN